MTPANASEKLAEIGKIVILGAGKMGSWLAREMHPIAEVAIFDPIKEKMEALSEIKKLASIGEIRSFCPDLLINAVSLQKTIAAFEEVLPYLSSQCLLADIASVKGELPKYYHQWSHPYVSTHPMFGPTFAHLEQLSQENAIIIRESNGRGKNFFRQFYRKFGINLYEYSFEEHDRIIAYSLTIPFASTMVFAACLETIAVPGTTFRKHLEIAKGLLNEDDYLLAEILFNPFSLPQVEKITQRLEFLKHIIRQKDYEEAINFFDRLRANIRS